MAYPVNIDVSIDDLASEPFGLGKNRPVLRNDIMAAKHQILGRLPLPRVGINIPGNIPCAGRFHEHFPVFVLSHRLIGSGQIHDYRSPGFRMGIRRRVRHPYIFTDLTAYLQSPNTFYVK